MLSELSIENFAIIDRLVLPFEAGFSVLTGETGAGKSIIIDALQAALGARIPGDVVRGDARSATVEAVFQWPQAEADGLMTLLDQYGIEPDECIILRRDVGATGRSTGRLNGRAVPVSVLSAAGSLLVDIHGQSDHLSILRRDRQLEVLDRYGSLMPLRSDVAEAIKRFGRARRALDELTTGRREAEQRLDLLRFQVQEIESAQLRDSEEEELEAERHLLSNAERLTHLSANGYEALQGDSASVLEGLAQSTRSVQELASIDPNLSQLSERLQAAQYELEDIAQDLRRYRDAVDYDPKRLNSIEERLELLARLKRKYGASVSEILDFGARARREMEDVEQFDSRFECLTAEAAEAERSAGELAQALSNRRTATAKRLAGEVRDALQDLGLKGSEFEVDVSRAISPDGLQLPGQDSRVVYTQTGVDSVTFMVSFNPGEPIRPLDRVASGGETSRFLLALKSVLAEADHTPTLIFDEVDVGIGGRSAIHVGERMRQLAQAHQVISITHLPQIAALADQHVTVAKKTVSGRVTVGVRTVEGADRISEIAEMMSGTGTEAARRNAEELLQAAHPAK
jgi:DNA repair protein RecN (Recombination protein N)